MSVLTLLAQDTPRDIFGEIIAPDGVAKYNAVAAASGGCIGVLIFIGSLIRLGTIVAGIWVLVNIILAGYQYITSSGDTSAHGKVRDRITMSVIGLVIIVAAYIIIGIIGLVFFGDAAYILNPTIVGPDGLPVSCAEAGAGGTE